MDSVTEIHPASCRMSAETNMIQMQVEDRSYPELEHPELEHPQVGHPQLGPGPAEPEVEPGSPDVEVLEKEDDGTGSDQPWHVILFNDEVHTFNEVIGQLVKATGCSKSRAEKLAWKVHTEGKANVFEGTFEECFGVQAVLKEIQLVTEIRG